MARESSITRWRELLLEKATLQKQQIDLDVEIQVLQKSLELESVTERDNTGTKIEEFVQQYGSYLDSDDIEFLQQAFRSTKEVVDHTGIPRTTLCRTPGRYAGIYREKAGARDYRWSTLSVMEFLIDAQAKEKD